VFESWQGQGLCFCETSTPALGPRQTPVQCVLGLKTPACDLHRSPQSGAEIKRVLSSTASSPVCVLDVCGDKSSFYVLFDCLTTLSAHNAIQGVSGGIVNILGDGSMDYSQ
jgi:hypothetical protein